MAVTEPAAVDVDAVVAAPPPAVWGALVDGAERRRWWGYLELDPVEITLRPAGAGTLVRVRHAGWQDLPDAEARAGAHRGGWRMHLANLAAHVDQRRTTGS